MSCGRRNSTFSVYLGTHLRGLIGIGRGELPAQQGAIAVSSGRSLKDAKVEFEREYIIQALKENAWNISKTAQVLGIERTYLHRRMKSFGIETQNS
ncbi:MAG: hypothetical protein KGP28_06800 [Bdellovibrionales bacterium]|nr:hypothetical protein [Bdellovibrionales bacterium]